MNHKGMRIGPGGRLARTASTLALVAGLAILATPAKAQIEASAVYDERLDFDEKAHLDWRESKYRVGFSALAVKDVETEVGVGIEVAGPDPFRVLGTTPTKLVPNWRVGFNQFDFPDPFTGAPTEVDMLSLAVGADYYFKGERNSAFLSAFVTHYVPDRRGGISTNLTKEFTGLNLGFGYESQRFRIRLDNTLLDGGGHNANTLGLGWVF